ncbi:hypothetical protein [Marinobacter sediminicola]|uniref:hypothetical protein n=1 Tax=Marinobacter sediminicola TaxID=3072994 RepID=UPI002811A982|nr:hypothetical protein [Marinobacter sp. F26243]
MSQKLSVFTSSFLLGSVPCFISVAKNGSKGLVDFVGSIDASDPTVLYLLALFLIQLVVSGLGHFKPGYKPGVNQRFRFYYAVVNSVGPGITCLTQVVSGAIFAAACVASWKYQEAGIWMVIGLWIMWPLFLAGAVNLDRVNRYAVEWQN